MWLISTVSSSVCDLPAASAIDTDLIAFTQTFALVRSACV